MTTIDILKQALYALEYASDMTKPEDLSGCNCPICTTIPQLEQHIKELESVEPVLWYSPKSSRLIEQRHQDGAANHVICTTARTTESSVPLYLHPPLNIPTGGIGAKDVNSTHTLRAAAQAVVDRWETPSWKDVPSTADFIYALRDALLVKDNSKTFTCAGGHEEPPCSDHPDAPHGFDRNASHNSGRYTCVCEGWKP